MWDPNDLQKKNWPIYLYPLSLCLTFSLSLLVTKYEFFLGSNIDFVMTNF